MQRFVRGSWACCGWAGTGGGHGAVLQRCLILGPGEAGLAGARAGWSCPLAPSCLEWHLWGGAALPGRAVLLLPNAWVWFHRRNGLKLWFGGLTALLPPPLTGQAVCSEGGPELHGGVRGTPAMREVTADMVANQTPKKSKGYYVRKIPIKHVKLTWRLQPCKKILSYSRRWILRDIWDCQNKRRQLLSLEE